MPIYRGDTKVAKMYLGQFEVATVWQGDNQVYPEQLSVSLSADKTSFEFPNDQITLTATAKLGTAPFTYDFQKNGVSQQSGASNVFTGDVGADGSVWTCVISDSGPDPDATSNAITVSVEGEVAPGSVTFTSAGTFTWVVPAGVSSIEVTAVGGGAGGGSGGKVTVPGQAGANRNVAHGGGGGSAGEQFVRQAAVVTPGETLTIVVGAGGAGGSTGSSQYGINGVSGVAGGATQLKRGATVLLSARGGNAGGGGPVRTITTPGGPLTTEPGAGGGATIAASGGFQGGNGGGTGGARRDQAIPPLYVNSTGETSAGTVPAQVGGSSSFYEPSYPGVTTGTPGGAGGSSSWGLGGLPGGGANNGGAGRGSGAGGGGGGGYSIYGYPDYPNHVYSAKPGGAGVAGRMEIFYGGA